MFSYRNQQTIYNNNTDSAFDSSGAIDFENRCNQDHVVFLDGVIPYISGANVIVVVETNFPPPKKQVRTTNNEINDNVGVICFFDIVFKTVSKFLISVFFKMYFVFS